MKRNTLITICVILLFVPVMITSGCKKKKEKKEKKPPVKNSFLGTWYMSRGKDYVLLIIRSDGKWSSNIRVEGLTSKIIEKKGSASGTWHIEDKNFVISVSESNIEEIWEKEKTLFCEIVTINKDFMTLRYPNGRLMTWKKAQIKSKGKKGAVLSPVIKIPPIVVNLNKISSNDRDRYFCIDMEFELQTLMPGEKPAKFHPRARDAAILFLSSLIYKNVNTFDAVNIEKKKLENILNPYFGGTLENIKINNIMITSNIDKVNEFIVEHTPKPPVVESKKDQKKS